MLFCCYWLVATSTVHRCLVDKGFWIDGSRSNNHRADPTKAITVSALGWSWRSDSLFLVVVALHHLDCEKITFAIVESPMRGNDQVSDRTRLGDASLVVVVGWSSFQYYVWERKKNAPSIDHLILVRAVALTFAYCSTVRNQKKEEKKSRTENDDDDGTTTAP